MDNLSLHATYIGVILAIWITVALLRDRHHDRGAVMVSETGSPIVILVGLGLLCFGVFFASQQTGIWRLINAGSNESVEDAPRRMDIGPRPVSPPDIAGSPDTQHGPCTSRHLDTLPGLDRAKAEAEKLRAKGKDVFVRRDRSGEYHIMEVINCK